MSIILYPLFYIAFWYVEIPIKMLLFFKSLNIYILYLFSTPLFLKTLFKPLKNEYRKDLVLFSRVMGVFVKTFLILFAFCVVVLVTAIELVLLFFYLMLPIILVYSLIL